ncbi:MAG: helix-turn-helix transcriptional regulator [Sulfurimonas sp.]|nr:helix-turn-helix transcriptional regulator [Sulfurimonas sp.]MDD3059652.1 helix-turn-helix transcriptional regulator [Sulfurimonas sp.]MDD5202872.1 helix-turn-helix transcriptional regulator [Sulfurimonas sp.]
MEVWEKINYLLEEKNITKQEFANKLVALEPKLKRTSESPSAQTILGYLYGKRELKIELIPYIAEVLNVDEQELFRFDIEYATEYNLRYSKDAREILELLQYSPKIMIENIKNVLQKFKKDYEDGIKKVHG